MKKLLLAVLVSLSTSAWADADVHVVSVQPRYITIQQQQCQQVLIEKNNSTLGAVIGGVAGGILGNTVGHGDGRTIATIAGTVTGAAVGNRIGQDQRSYESQTICQLVPTTVQQGEIVTFSYKGRVFMQGFN